MAIAFAVLLVLYPLSIAPVAIAYQRCTGRWPELGTADYKGVALVSVGAPVAPGSYMPFPITSRRSRVLTTLYWPILRILADSSGMPRNGDAWNYLFAYCRMWGLTTDYREHGAHPRGPATPTAPPPPGYHW
ncbi:hypothetical protein DB346_13700 [Verrucomicrobia bacterium LW23]|nr:hypothetical protein DB346_13700 [Verrucomicrobia bacterium LW23]